ncbi:MAG: hypothetical protein P8X82_16790, partial [Gemmatimonadales bacterium]
MRYHARLAFIALLAILPSCSDGVVDLPDDEITGPKAQLRAVHTLAGIAPMDVIVGGRVVLQSLAFGAPSEFVDVPAGTQPVGFRLTGTTTAPQT